MKNDGNFRGSALEVAREIKEVFDSYWISTQKTKIAALVEYLELWSEKDEYDDLKEERERLTKRLSEVEKKLGGYDHEEMENWKPYGTNSSESPIASISE